MENLNAERIKRGLECCKGSYDCFTCDIYKRGCAGFREGLAKDALALIKELTEENEYLKTQLTATEARCESRKESDLEEVLRLRIEVEELTEENKVRKGLNSMLDNELRRLGEENERLRAENEIKSQKRANIFEIANAFERGRADGARKMHSAIKERCIKGGIYPAFVKSTIDQIAKEMLEGE